MPSGRSCVGEHGRGTATDAIDETMRRDATEGTGVRAASANHTSKEGTLMTITVYTKPNCPQCEATKRQLTRQGLDFNVIDLTQDPAALDTLRAAGFMQAPVVMTDDDSWAGYRPDKIRALAKAKAVAAVAA